MNQLSSPLQFGNPVGEYLTRPCAYGVVVNAAGEFLVVNKTNGRSHLPGGGIEQGEDPATALARELVEETGCTVGTLTFLGKANQFFPNSEKGPMNKVAVFYSTTLIHQDDNLRVEHDHIPAWLTYEEVQQADMGEFQKWAVEQAHLGNNAPSDVLV